MNTRRGFIGSILKAGVACAVLPAAATYGRTWKRTSEVWVPNPAWESAPYELYWVECGFGHRDNLVRPTGHMGLPGNERVDYRMNIVPRFVRA